MSKSWLKPFSAATFVFLLLSCDTNKHTVFTDFYELYAGDARKEEIAKTVSELDFAVDRYRYYLQEEPLPLAVLLVSSPEEVKKYDLEGFLNRNMLILTRHVNSGEGITTNIEVIPEAGIVLSQFPKQKVRVADILAIDLDSSRSVTFLNSSSFEKNDVINAINGKEVLTLKDLITAYNNTGTGDTVNVEVIRDNTNALVSFRKPRKVTKFSTQVSKSSSAFGKPPETNIYSHEAMHSYFMSYVNKQLGVSTVDMMKATAAFMKEKGIKRNYGHPVIPDWFDEAMAMLAENDSSQMMRRAQAKDDLNNLIPLEQLFTMTHPAEDYSSSKLMIDSFDVRKYFNNAFSDSALKLQIKSTITNTTSSPGEGGECIAPTGAELLTSVFYSQISSFMYFLVQQEGEPIVKKIADGLISKMSMQQILKKHARNVPADLKELEKAWIAYVRSQ